MKSCENCGKSYPAKNDFSGCCCWDCYWQIISNKDTMQPYEDKNCKCHQIEKEIINKYPNCNWNCDDACREWQTRQKELKDNNIAFKRFADENYGCTCPTCGRMICVWCV